MQPRTISKRLLAAAAAITTFAGIASATPITITNSSFESVTLTNGQTGAISGWSTGGTVTSFNPTDDYFPNTTDDSLGLPAPANGTNYLVMNMTSTAGFAWLNVGDLQSNTIYTLTVDYGCSFMGLSGTGFVGLVNGTTPFGTLLASIPMDTSSIEPGTFSEASVVFSSGNSVSGKLTLLIEGVSGSEFIVDNVRLDATAASGTLTALTPTVSPKNAVNKGTAVTLTENPAGTPPFTYQWQTDKGTGTFSDISDATSTNYVIDTSSFGTQAVQYRVVVTGTSGKSTSPAVSISIITGAPTIVTDATPAYAWMTSGSSITFTASFEGTEPMTYQWYEGGSPIDGATNLSLTLSDVDYASANIYSVSASNSEGTTSSSDADLVIFDAPQATNGILINIENEFGWGGTTLFTPQWNLESGSLISGLAPSATTVYSGSSFSLGNCGTTDNLTDDSAGTLYPSGNGSPDYVTCGNSAGGTSITYVLPTSSTGYDLDKIVAYGGWSDSGRDQQFYIASYSTVASPDVFNAIASVYFNPDTSDSTLPTSHVQSSGRSTITATNGILAKNVYAVKFVFNDKEHGTENGYNGYSEFQVFGKASAAAPIIASDIRPSTAVDVVGSSIIMTASFSSDTTVSYQWQADKGSGFVNISGATSNTLVLSSLKASDAGSYRLKASNVSGSTTTGSCTVTVNDAPSPDENGMLVSYAGQTGTSDYFTPTWAIDTNSLIAGDLPSASGSGFTTESAGGVTFLTDGSFGYVGSGDNSTLATCGSSYGTYLVYTTMGDGYGIDISNIVTFAGWTDKGRDEQAYAVYYATASDPQTFIYLTYVDYNPDVASGVKTTDRVTIKPGSGSVFATNVVKVKFDFTNPAGENGYSGYAEIQFFGKSSAPMGIAPIISSDITPATASDVVGSEVTILGGTFDSALPYTYQWQKDGSDISGATNQDLTLKDLTYDDSGTYTLTAINVIGTATSSECVLTVNDAPQANENGVLVACAAQTTTRTATLTPTWTISTNSVIEGDDPIAKGSGSFTTESAGGVLKLTDGDSGYVGGGDNSTLATCGSAQGTYLVYATPGDGFGIDLSSIITIAGWSDNGRDEQAYSVYYATVSDPNTFVLLTTADYNPDVASSIRTVDRLTITPGTGSVLAKNVVKVKFDFTSPAGENGYSGYGEIQIFGTPSASINIAPIMTADIIPFTASDVLGATITITGAKISGALPLTYQWQKDGADLAGATSLNLVLANLKATDAGTYTLTAKNSLGSLTTSSCVVTVNDQPSAVNGILTTVATQTGTNYGKFTPTWTVASGSILEGQAPSSVGSGNTTYEGCGGVVVLTDGTFGYEMPPGNSTPSAASLGSGVGGKNVVYTFAEAKTITNITVYGGWSDSGRDQQAYTILYSTSDDPTNFISLTSVNYNPTLPGTVESATRVVLTPETGSYLAANVANLKFDFTSPAGENGWSGYNEIQVFGSTTTTTSSSPTLGMPVYSNGNATINITGGTPNGSFTWLTSTNVTAPLSSWTAITTGTFDSKGNYSATLPVSLTNSAQFFMLKTQ